MGRGYKTTRTSRRPLRAVCPVLFSPDGKFLASASAVERKWVDLDGKEGGTKQGSYDRGPID